MFRIDHTKSTMENMVGLANETYLPISSNKLAVGDFTYGVPSIITPGAGNNYSNTSIVLTGVNEEGRFGTKTLEYKRHTLTGNRPSIGLKFMAAEANTHAENQAVILSKLRLVAEEIVFTNPPIVPQPGQEMTYTLAPRANSPLYVSGSLSVSVRGRGVSTLSSMNANTWQQLSPGAGPAARVCHTAETIDDKLYIHGGYTAWTSTPVGDTWCYDPKTNTWTERAAGPTLGRSFSAVVDGIFYVYGGKRSAGNAATAGVAELWKYDPVADQWTQLPDGPYAAFAGRAVAIGTTIYFVGGTSGGVLSNAYRTYDTVTQTWGTFTDNGGIYAHVLVEHGGSLYRYFGINSANGLNNRVDRLPLPSGSVAQLAYTNQATISINAAHLTYNGKTYIHGGTNLTTGIYSALYSHEPTGNAWATLATGPSARASHSMVEIGGRFYMFGGSTNTGYTTFSSELWVYSPEASLVIPTADPSNAWKQLATGPTMRAAHASAVMDGKLFIQGGYSVWGNAPLSDFWHYDTILNQWTQLANGPALGRHAMVAVNGAVYVYGGSAQTGSGTTVGVNQFWKYDLSTNTWTQLANGPLSLYGHRAVAVGDVIYFVGGYSNGAAIVNSSRTYDTVNETWGTFAFDIATYTGALVKHDATLYRYFGRDAAAALSSRVDKLLTPSGSWESVSFAGEAVVTINQGATAFNGKSYIFGGQNLSGTLYNNLYSHDPVANTWEALATGPTARILHTTDAINGRLYTFGGSTNVSASAISNELWVYKL